MKCGKIADASVTAAKLKSDYFRIEIELYMCLKIEYPKLKSDYFRIEIGKGGTTKSAIKHAKIRLF